MPAAHRRSEIIDYQHHLYAVVYSVILAPGLLGNVLALWVFRAYIRETKKAVVFMMNLAVADLLQVLSLPLRIYYYLNNSWPFGYFFCMFCFYLKYVNMYTSIYFLVFVSIRRCELIMRPLLYNSGRQKGDVLICGIIWLIICTVCLGFPLLRHDPSLPERNDTNKCFTELPLRKDIGPSAMWALLILLELFGFFVPLVLVLGCTCMTIWSLRENTANAISDRGEKKRALRMILSCAVVFLVCFVPYHATMPLDLMVKAKKVTSCDFQKLVLRSHPVTLCLASLNCSLDPIMYYFTTDEFWRRLSKPEIPESIHLRNYSNKTESNVINETCISNFSLLT
uniref:G protein-coupled receptor 174 n=1 Tax=Neolamprologus brichardi TaxID=32507 RepID=A0A3Q4N445_NEOBR